VKDTRFGIVTSIPGTDWQLSELGVDWYIDYTSSAIPGKDKLIYLRLLSGDTRMSPADIASRAEAAPGSVWYLGGEPNIGHVGVGYGITPAEYVLEFDYYRAEIKGADPTALITGPSVLNWSFTCSGGCSFQSGESWMTQFIDLYRASHGGAPPAVDIWAIDSYPLTWDSVPMVNWQIVADQLSGFRGYLIEDVPEHANTPIWLTEVASHWGYSKLGFNGEGSLIVPTDLDPIDDYEWDAMEGYLVGLLDWLRENGPALKIEKWFFYRAYVNPAVQVTFDAYAGLYFFEGSGEGAALNQLGQVYRDYALGLR